ncbi:MAG TPA: glutamine--fructose-6-phosphate transaminase (isomerizing) [Syntrophaceae bacterium]|nr:glutamine--fructose-6-phosphate transaminase (isomerizing) [Syntrophaceae bacterium]
MCGIVGYIGQKDAVGIILNCLKKLEYRGYDSAGIATVCEDKIEVRRGMGKIAELEFRITEKPLTGTIGLGHTRWATHGIPSDRNAHPHVVGDLAVVHNGIIENYLTLKQDLESEGCVFTSDTDTEVIPHLIHKCILKGLKLEEAVIRALSYIKGSYALIVLRGQEPQKLIVARQESPLIIGVGEGEYFIASDIPALLSYTRKVMFLDDGDIAVVKSHGVDIRKLNGTLVTRQIQEVHWSPTLAEKAGYKHFMQKEIFEQPRAIIDTFRTRIRAGREISFEPLNLTRKGPPSINKIFIVACGTSWHAALVGKFMIEELCRIPVEVDLSSEFRYRNPILDERCLLILISQSGETADTLAALKEGKSKGTKTLAICNVVGSSLARNVDDVLYTYAGPEIGVASTKTFTTQLVALYLLAIHLGRMLNRIDMDYVERMIKDLVRLPHLVEEVLDREEEIKSLAKTYVHYDNFLYLGRGINYPIALEGALKLKEISYIHAEGYPAGEMKHGPIALIDEGMPVVVLAPKGNTFQKIMSNIEEVLARRGKIVVLTQKGNKELIYKANSVIYIPESNPLLIPILLTVPLQLLSYHIATLRGTDVDQPRNLAKSVTVE